jgi:hypothetical protein
MIMNNIIVKLELYFNCLDITRKQQINTETDAVEQHS